MVFFSYRCCISNRDGRFDDHGCIRIYFQYKFNDCLYCGTVEEVLFAVIVGRSCNDYEIGMLICFFAIQCSGKIQLFFSKILFDVIILDRRLFVINEFYFLWNDIDGCYMVMLGKKCSNRQTYVTGTGNGNVVFLVENRLCYSRFFLFKQIRYFESECFRDCLKLINRWNIIQCF